ncbi:hypothetical protein CEXT_280131 [Caerostris extrusa]|uniref:Secreted protein n=1 Tax=Caerostris extrusa TaxID=172846 RepID=A0AAV4XTV6_CAEEX|nr:hypothetical protein CEXT_280131 [Caerostris extrusa]
MTTQEMTFLHLFLSLFLPVLVCQKFANPFPRRTWAPVLWSSGIINSLAYKGRGRGGKVSNLRVMGISFADRISGGCFPDFPPMRHDNSDGYR